jgi:hypothetical protein
LETALRREGILRILRYKLDQYYIIAFDIPQKNSLNTYPNAAHDFVKHHWPGALPWTVLPEKFHNEIRDFIFSSDGLSCSRAFLLYPLPPKYGISS